jgi:hypothetical protein
MPDPIRVVTAPSSGAPRAGPTRPGRRRETCMRAHGQVAGNPQLGQREGNSQVLQMPRLLYAVGAATAPPGASGRPWPTLLPVRQAVGHICTRRSA